MVDFGIGGAMQYHFHYIVGGADGPMYFVIKIDDLSLIFEKVVPAVALRS